MATLAQLYSHEKSTSAIYMHFFVFIYIYIYIYIYNRESVMHVHWQLFTTNTFTIKRYALYRPHLAINMENELCDTLLGNLQNISSENKHDM